MNLRRSQRIFWLAQGTLEHAQKASIREWENVTPSYESTKGSNPFQQELAIRGWQELENQMLAEVIRRNLEKEINSLKNQNVPTINLKVTRENITENITENDITSSNEHAENQRKISGDDSFSEDKSSGSEYIPSTDDELDSPFSGCDKSTSEEPSIFRYKPDTKKSITPRIFESKIKQKRAPIDETLCRAGTKINIISNVLLKSENNKNENNSKNVDLVIAPAESTTPDADSRVKISAAQQTIEGKRIRNKKHCCYFCHEMILHIARHLEVKHATELDVARALAFPKKSNKRKELFSEITRAGDFHYNCEVLSLKRGELILVRRPTINEIRFNKYRDYGPCPNCLGFLLKKHLWHHMRAKCPKKYIADHSGDTDQANRQVIAESNAILNCVFGSEFTNDYTTYILNSIRDDDVGNCCKEDNLILKFGCMQFEKYGTTQAELIRQNMRQLARLTMTIRQISSQNLKLFDLLTPQKFDLVVQGVKELCQRQQNDSTRRPEFLIPSLALKLGYSLKKCANIERGLALRQENLRRNESLLAFCNLMELEWQIRISSNALSTLYKRKLNTGQLLPVTNDLLKCNNYIKTEIERVQRVLVKTPNSENWSRLAKLILCRIILFNKRRAGEASKMTLEQYNTRPLWSEQTNEDLKISLTPYELKLTERHIVVNIIGKRGRFVPVLLTPETKIAIDILLSHRSDAVGVHPQNPYIFARGSRTLSHMRGPDVLRKIIGEVENLEKPDLISSTKLRKYVATVCQIFDLSENEYDWLARHLGHDIKVHREFYRLHDDVIELTKVSRLLMAVDSGEANKFSGMQLKDIKLEDLPPVEEEDEDMQEIDNDLSEDVPENKNVVRQNSEDAVTKIGTFKGQKQLTKSTPWDTNDKKVVFEHFKTHIKNGIVPGKADCEACQQKYSPLKIRRWTDIKFCVKNQITKIKKLKKNQQHN